MWLTEKYMYLIRMARRKMIRVPERPSTLQFGGKDGNTLFVTGRSKFFGVRIK